MKEIAKTGIAVAMGLLAALWLPLTHSFAQETADEVREALREQLESAPDTRLPAPRDQRIWHQMERFYEHRSFAPAWSERGAPRAVVAQLTSALRHAGEQGLRPQDYALRRIDNRLEEIRDARRRGSAPGVAPLADLDVLLTAAFLDFARDLLQGRVDPRTLHRDWQYVPRDKDLAQLLEGALASDRVAAALAALTPPYPDYAALRGALQRYRDVAAHGGFPSVASGPTLALGDRSTRVAQLRRRLAVSGDLPGTADQASELFDEIVEQGLRAFQARHGLLVDGVLGPRSTAALNVPARARVEQIVVNLERWRWLPEDLGERYIVLNIPDFTVEVIDQGRPVMRMRAIVGKPYLNTPVFSAKMTYLVLSPYWQVPPSIARTEFLPRLRRDPDFLTRERIEVFHGWGPERRSIDPHEVDWARISARRLPYHFRQQPGPHNPLGRVKFMFPNRFNVYLHDTPSRSLFSRSVRAFSHGCVRIAKPIELAEYLLRDSPHWTRERILQTIARGRARTVLLPQPITVHIFYFTAWVDDQGKVQFRDDLYGRDGRLAAALDASTPLTAAAP